MSNEETPDLIDELVAEWLRARPKTAPQAMHVVGRIIRLGQAYEEAVVRMLRPHRLSYSDFDVLATLRRSGAPYEMAPTQLQASVLLTSGAMTACLGRLERRGLIFRVAGQTDRRRLSAGLTPAGHELVEQLIDQRFSLADEALTHLTVNEVDTLELLLRRLGRAGSDARPGKPRPPSG
jgi:DNA-binding MarR family transcriptional regulator